MAYGDSSKPSDSSYELTKTMLRCGGNPNTCYLDGMTPFLLCVESNTLKEVMLHLNFKAAITTVNMNGETALHLAVKNWMNPDVLEQMLRYSKLDMEAQDNIGFTPLHYAVSYGYVNACKSLLRRGALLSTKGYDSFTPLGMAVKRQMDGARDEPPARRQKRQSVIELLLRYIALMVHSNSRIDENDAALIQSNQQMRDYYTSCSVELKHTRQQVYYRNETLFDLLRLDLDEMFERVKDAEFANAIEFVQKPSVPLYYDMIRDKYNFVLRAFNNNNGIMRI